jgi:hypothetical protein
MHIRETTRRGINHQRQNANDAIWHIWVQFCIRLHCDPELANIADPIPLLQIFAQCYRPGAIPPSGSPVCSRTVEQALRAMSQVFAALGCRDPRLSVSGKLDFHLSHQLSAYSKENPPPTRVKPIPLPVIGYAADMCHLTNTAYSYAIADMLMLGIYFLLCPGEYAFTTNIDTSPFHLCDVYLLINTRRLDMIAVPEQDLNQANFVALEFTNQKNGVFGELVGLGHSGHPSWCPVQAILSRIRHLWQHNAQPTTPPYRYYDRSWRNLDTSTLMSHLRITVTPLGHLYGIKPDEISVRSLLASGAMALLCAKVDTDTICPLRSVVF